MLFDDQENEFDPQFKGFNLQEASNVISEESSSESSDGS